MDLMMQFINSSKAIKLYNGKYKSITDGTWISMKKAYELIKGGNAGIQIRENAAIPYLLFIEALKNTEVIISSNVEAVIDTAETEYAYWNYAAIIGIANTSDDELYINRSIIDMISDDVLYTEFPKYKISKDSTGAMKVCSKESIEKYKVAIDNYYTDQITGGDNILAMKDFSKEHVIVNFAGNKISCCRRADCEKALKDYKSGIARARRINGFGGLM